jgi:hypothetical protein
MMNLYLLDLINKAFIQFMIQVSGLICISSILNAFQLTVDVIYKLRFMSDYHFGV